MKRILRTDIKTIGDLRMLLSDYDDGLEFKRCLKVYITQVPNQPFKMVIKENV